MEDMALDIGLDLLYFWSINPTQFNKHLASYNKRVKDDSILYDEIAYSIGLYVSRGFHDPKNYPEKPYSHKQGRDLEIMTDEEMEKIARRNTIMLGGKVE